MSFVIGTLLSRLIALGASQCVIGCVRAAFVSAIRAHNKPIGFHGIYARHPLFSRLIGSAESLVIARLAAFVAGAIHGLALLSSSARIMRSNSERGILTLMAFPLSSDIVIQK